MSVLVWAVCLLATGATVGPAQRSANSASAPKMVRGSSKAPLDLVWMVGSPVSEPEGPAPANTAKLRARGVKLFKQRCAACHGAWGDGKGPAAADLSLPMPDLTKGIYKLRSTPSGTLPTAEDLFVTISRGMHGTEMFPWARLSEADRWALVYRVMSFSPRFKHEQPGTPFVVPPAPAETPELVAEGAALYERHRCGACHGDKGGADGPAVKLYEQPEGPRVVNIRDFQKGQFLRGSDMADVFLTLKTGLDGTPMGPYDALSARELWALSAFVRDLVQRRRVP